MLDFDEVPANRFFGLKVRSRGEGSAELSMPLNESYGQEGGVVHGGIISTLADTAAVYAVYPDLADSETMTSIEFKVNFLRPALADGGDLVACSKLVKRGKRVALCEVEVSQDGKAVAKGLFTYLIFESDSS